MIGVHMINPPYFDEISDYIENNITQPDIILKNLYDKYLTVRNTRSAAKNKSHFFYSLPAIQHIIKNNAKKLEQKKPESTLNHILNLYYTTDTQNKQIISILSAYISFFPNETYKLPKDIITQLHIINAFHLLSSLFDEPMISKMIAEGKVIGLDDRLRELPDKGEKILRHAVQEMHEQEKTNKYDNYLKSFAELPKTIAMMPLELQKNIITNLVKRLEAGLHNSALFAALDALYPSVSLFPVMLARTYKKLHKILRSKRNQCDWKSAAHCLNQLTEYNDCYDSNDNNITMNYYLNYLHKPNKFELDFTLESLGNLENIVKTCDKKTAEQIILEICNILNTTRNGCIKTTALQTLGNLNQVICNLSDDTIREVVNGFMHNLPHLEDFNRSFAQSPAYSISKLQNVLEKKIVSIKEILKSMFDELISNSTADNKNIISELLLSWRPLIMALEDQGASFIDKLYQHFENDPEDWMPIDNFKELISCFAHLPKEARSLVAFFHSKLNDENKNCYAIKALGFLQFSLLEHPQTSFDILAWMNDRLNEHQNADLVSSIIIAFNNMTGLLAMHTQLIKPIIMHLCALSYPWNRGQCGEIIKQLQIHLKYPSFTANDKQIIAKTFEDNISFTEKCLLTADMLCFMSQDINKKAMIDKKFMSLSEFITTRYSRELSQMLTKIAINLQHQHPKQLSWACVLVNYMKYFSTKHHLPNYIDLANALGTLFLPMKRQALIANKLPKELARCVEEYVDNDYLASYKKF